jgi:hypothetical protein
MNLLDWAQVALSVVVMLTGLYIAVFRHFGRGVLATTRVGGFGVALLGLSYLVGGFEGPAVEGPLLTRVEAYSALTGVLVVLGALVWQVRSRSWIPKVEPANGRLVDALSVLQACCPDRSRSGSAREVSELRRTPSRRSSEKRE